MLAEKHMELCTLVVMGTYEVAWRQTNNIARLNTRAKQC